MTAPTGRQDKTRFWTIGDLHAGQRIDNFLFRELKGVPKQLIYRLLRTGRIRVNKAKVSPSTKLVLEDVIGVPVLRTAKEAQREPVVRDLPEVVFEDRNYLIYNKPAGLAVHGGSGFIQGLIETARNQRDDRYLELAHRLDKDTSGLLVLAKKPASLRHFHSLLRERKVAKKYLACVVGEWMPNLHAEIDVSLKKVPAGKGGRRAIVVADGSESLTRTKCLRQFRAGALLSVELVTGRTHQARAHLAHVDLPILGDDRYGDRTANRQARRAGCQGMLLHSQKISFRSMDGSMQYDFDASLPARFEAAYEWLSHGLGQP